MSETRLRIGDRTVLARADGAASAAILLGPLRTLRDDAVRRDVPIELSAAAGDVPAAVRAAAGDVPATGAFVSLEGAGWVVAARRGGARIARGGGVVVHGIDAAPAGDALAEHVTIPALAERLRPEGTFLVHAAVVEVGGRAWIVPGARGSGKTTLALSIARLGATLRSDDRAFLLGEASTPLVDPWPEPPRVGDRTRFLLPAGTRLAERDARTGKALAEALAPERAKTPIPVAGVLLPRLVEGPGGVGSRAHGARVLAALASQAVVVNDPTTAAATLAWLAKILQALPAFDVDVGSNPEQLRPLLSLA